MSAKEFLTFVEKCPTSYHTVDTVARYLLTNGYEQLKEETKWTVNPGDKYFVTRNNSSLIALELGPKWVPGESAAIVSAHTDSPTLRLKPKSRIYANGYVKLGVETYGGGLWPTWFDRDLSVAGIVRTITGDPLLVKIDKPLLRIPTLAIHLHHAQSTKLEFNKETHLQPILQLQGDENGTSKHPSGLMTLIAKQLGINADDIVDFDLMLFDTQKPAIGGLNDEFIFSPRLDNLNSCFCGLKGLLETSNSGSNLNVLALFDHEEVGSTSAQGANSNFLQTVLSRISPNDYHESIAKSFMISADMAHSVHPNYPEKHEHNHVPRINGGPVIKVNANQRYATNTYGITLLKRITNSCSVPAQEFVVRNDSTCGSTIGPMMSANLGLTTIDIGNPQLSMHSIREMAGVDDIDYSIKLFSTFYQEYSLVISELNKERVY